VPQQPDLTSQQVTRYFEENPKASVSSAAAHFGVAGSTINTRIEQGAGGRRLVLTDHDVRVFRFIVDFIVDNGWAPSVTEIFDALGCARSAAHVSIHRLASYGCLILGDGARTIRVVGMKFDTKGVPDDPR
jgi:hypothetical protein